MADKLQSQFEKGKHFFDNWGGVVLGFLIAISTTLMSIVDFTSIESGNPFKELTAFQYVLIAVSIVVKGLGNMFIFRSFIKSGIEKGKKDEDYQAHLNYQDDQITKCLAYRELVDKKCDEDNYKELRSVYFAYCNHFHLLFNDVFNDDLTLKLDYVPKNKTEKKALKELYKNCYINEISSALLFDSSIGKWERNKKIVLEKDYIAKNSSTTMGMLFSALTSALSIAPFMFSASGIIMAGVNFGVIIGLAWYKHMNAFTYVKEELGGEVRRRGLKLEAFYIEIINEEKAKKQISIVPQPQPIVKVVEQANLVSTNEEASESKEIIKDNNIEPLLVIAQ